MTSGNSVEIQRVITYVRQDTHKTAFCGGVRCAWPLYEVSHVLLLACTISNSLLYDATLHVM